MQLTHALSDCESYEELLRLPLLSASALRTIRFLQRKYFNVTSIFIEGIISAAYRRRCRDLRVKNCSDAVIEFNRSLNSHYWKIFFFKVS